MDIMEIIMLMRMFEKMKLFLKDERTTEEKIISYQLNVSSYRSMSIAFAVVFLYTITCSLILPDYKPSWIAEEIWFSLRNCWFMYLTLMISSLCWCLKAKISKDKLLKKVA